MRVFVCWDITQVSLRLMCNVHFVQSTQSTRLQTRPFMRGINNLLNLPRSPDIKLCDLFFLRYVRDWIFVPPFPRDLAYLKPWIIVALKNIDAPMLTRVWQELEYLIDVCRVTRVAHIEHL
jgi:hypothetical protein